MGRKSVLKPEAKKKITQLLNQGKTGLDISKIIHRDHCTVKSYVANSNKVRQRSDKGTFQKISRPEISSIKGTFQKISRLEISSIKRVVAKKTHSTSFKIFDETGAPTRSGAGRCTILKSIGKVTKPIVTPPLKARHKLARLQWAKTYMKTNFEHVLFTDKSRATLDGPDGWMSGWLLNGTKPQSRIRRQQGGGGVIIWAGIINDAIVGPFAVPDGVKMNAKSYVEFLKKNFLPWYRKQ